MPNVTELRSERPSVWVTEDRAPNGTVRAIIGIRVLNDASWPVRVQITAGKQGDIMDWWTPLGRADAVLQVGEDVTSPPFRIPAGQADSFSIYAGLA